MAEPETRVSLIVDDRLFAGWTSVTVRRSLDRTCGSFDLSFTERWAGQPERRRLLPGQSCTVALDGEPVLVGYVDKVDVAYDHQTHGLTCTGRDKAGDLIDGAATVDGPYEYAGLTIAQIAARLCTPYGLAVRAEVDVGRPFARFALQPGETAWTAIERGCRQRGVLPLADGIGGLVLTRAGTGRLDAVLQLGRNVKAGKGSFDFKDRHSVYVALGQHESGAGGDAESAASGRGRATDPAVTRYRPLVLTAETQGDGQSLQDRADWQARVSAGKSRRVGYTVQDWRTAAGELWRPNALVRVTDDYLDLATEMLIVGVTFRLSDQGTVTELELGLPDAYALQDAPAEDEEGLLR